MQTKCKLCGKVVLVVKSARHGGIVVYDAEPNSEGSNIVVEGEGFCLDFDPIAPMIGLPRHIPHVATCSEWKKIQEKAK